MGRIVFGPKVLPDDLTEIAGYKVELAMSIEEICGHLTASSFPDAFRDGETFGVRLRYDEYEDLYYSLCHGGHPRSALCAKQIIKGFKYALAEYDSA